MNNLWQWTQRLKLGKLLQMKLKLSHEENEDLKNLLSILKVTF